MPTESRLPPSEMTPPERAGNVPVIEAKFRSWLERGVLALLLANAALLVYYICVGYEPYFHSDAAVKNLIAGEIYRTGHFFPPGWNYVNGDLFIVFGHLFIVPFLPFVTNGFSLHALSGLVSAAIILGSAWLLSGVATRSTLARLVFLAVLASGISSVVAENVFGQVSYGTIFYFSAFSVYFGWNVLHAQGRSTLVWGALLAAAMVLAFWANPQRAIATYWIPLAVAIAIHAVSAGSWRYLKVDRGVVRGGIVLLLMGGCALAGSLLHIWTLSFVNNTPGAGAAKWLDFGNIVKNGGYTLEGLLAILGALPSVGSPVMSIGGMYDGFRLLAGFAALLLIPWALLRCCSGVSDGARFVGVFTTISGVIFVFLHVTTTIPDMQDPVTSARYLVPFVLFGLLMVVVALSKARSVTQLGMGALALLALATSCASPSNPLSQGFGQRLADPRVQLIGLLESNQLQYGYASFWNAGALTVLSDGKTVVRQIKVEGGLPKPFRHLASNHWFQESAWQGQTFLMLTPEESQLVDWNLLASYIGPAIRTIDSGGVRIYVYPRNIAGALPNWDIELEHPLNIRASANTPHTAGTFDPSDGAMVAAEGVAGFLNFGPYATLVPGNYRASFDVEVRGGHGQFGTLDVASSQGKDVHAVVGVTTGGRQHVEVPFRLDRGVDDLELRVNSTGAANFRFYGIKVQRDESKLVAP